MTSLDYSKAKWIITDACNSTGLLPADLVGVLSAILAEAREQMCFELASENVELQEQIEKIKQKQIEKKKEGNDGNG